MTAHILTAFALAALVGLAWLLAWAIAVIRTPRARGLDGPLYRVRRPR